MKNRILILFSLFVLILQTSCGGNLFKEISKSTSDEALIVDAQKYIDDGSWTDAITVIEQQMTASARTRSDVIEMWAGAYAGRCGQSFIALVNGLSSSTGAPFLFFMKAFQAITVIPADCYTAQQKMEIIGDATKRTSDENFFMFFLGISKIGSYLKSKADISPTDGAADSSFDPCDKSKISDTEVAQVITGLGLILDNITAVGSSISNNSTISSMNTLCNSLGFSCVITDPNSSSITSTVSAVFRQLIATSDFGIQSTCTSSQLLPTTGVSPCCPSGVH